MGIEIMDCIFSVNGPGNTEKGPQDVQGKGGGEGGVDGTTSFLKKNMSNSYRKREIEAYLFYCCSMGKGIKKNENPEQQDNKSLSVDRYPSRILRRFQPMGKHKRHGLFKNKTYHDSVSRIQKLHP